MSNLTNNKSLPAWAESLRQKYLAGEASMFLLHGNVFDKYLVDGKAWLLVDFLSEVLLKGNKEQILELSLRRGLRVLRSAAGANGGENGPGLVLKLGENGIPALLETIEQRMKNATSSALIVPYAGTVLPGGDPQFLSTDERVTLTTLHNWSLDSLLSDNDNVVILISESLSEINQALVSNPRVAALELPMPNYAEREAAVRHFAPKMEAEQQTLMTGQTAGLRVLQIASIVAGDKPGALDEAAREKLIRGLIEGPDADARAKKLASITAAMTPDEIRAMVNPAKPIERDDSDPFAEMLEVVRKRKRELIEKECAGLIEFIEPKHGLDVVGGNENIKTELMDIANTLKSGDRTLAPMGLLAVGAMGAGKTFVIKAFLKEAGLSGVALKNFRSKWVGSTESNLERVLTTVKAMGPIAVIIDEGDRSFGKQGEDTDGGTSSRVIARLKEFMSDTENRGHVLFVLMTNRPDKLDTDIKRPGRLDRKIPFFYADNAIEQTNIIAAILKRYKIANSLDYSRAEILCEHFKGYSNADLEAVTLLAADFAQREKKSLDEAIFLRAATDFIPPREDAMIEFMELLAVREASRRSLLPERFQKLSSAELDVLLKHKRLELLQSPP